MWVRQFVGELRTVVRRHNLRLPEHPLQLACSGNFCILRDSHAMKAVRIVWGNPGAHRLYGGDAQTAGEIAWRQLDEWKPSNASHVVSETSQQVMDASDAVEIFLGRIL